MNIEDVLRQPVDDIVTETNTVTGVQYSKLFQIASENGFSDKEFKQYLDERGVKIKTFGPPEQEFSNTRLF